MRGPPMQITIRPYTPTGPVQEPARTRVSNKVCFLLPTLPSGFDGPIYLATCWFGAERIPTDYRVRNHVDGDWNRRVMYRRLSAQGKCTSNTTTAHTARMAHSHLPGSTVGASSVCIPGASHEHVCVA